MIPFYSDCRRYNTLKRKNAQTSPTAQYTLVSINGRNSIVFISAAPWMSGTAQRWSASTHVMLLLPAAMSWATVDVDVVNIGISMTKTWRT